MMPQRMNKFKHTQLLLAPIYVSLVLASSQALADTVPASAQAGRVSQTLQQEELFPKKAVASVATAPLQTPQLSKEAASVHFKLKGVVIEGNTVYPQADLYWVFRNYLDHDITLAQLYEIAQQITLKYRNNGYVLSKAYIPPQSVQNGVVHISIVEGYVDKVIVEGQAPNTTPLIQAYGDRVKNAGPLRMQTLERYTLLANDLPGVKVRAILKPSEKNPGAATLVFLAEEKRFEGYANYNNRGTRYLGTDQFLVGADVNNIFRMGDNTEVRYATVNPLRRLQFTALTHQQQIGTDGTLLSFNTDYTHTAPGGSLSALKIDARSADIGLKLSFPFIRTRQENFYGDTELKFTKAKSEILTNNLLFDDKIYTFAFGGSYDAVDILRGTYSIKGHVTQGFPIFNANEPSDTLVSRPGARSDFTRFNLDIAREQALFSQFTVLLAASGQFATQELYSVEQFGMGSSPYGGTFDPSEIVGDHGLAGKVELRYLIPSNNLFAPATQMYLYYDGGEVWSARHQAPGRQSLTSMGVGSRFHFVKYLDGYIEFAKPLTRAVAAEASVGKGRQGRVFVGISARV